jgi:hypothetical protein
MVAATMRGLAHRKRSVEQTPSRTIESEFMSAKDTAAFLGIPLRSLDERLSVLVCDRIHGFFELPSRERAGNVSSFKPFRRRN